MCLPSLSLSDPGPPVPRPASRTLSVGVGRAPCQGCAVALFAEPLPWGLPGQAGSAIPKVAEA